MISRGLLGCALPAGRGGLDDLLRHAEIQRVSRWWSDKGGIGRAAIDSPKCCFSTNCRVAPFVVAIGFSSLNVAVWRWIAGRSRHRPAILTGFNFAIDGLLRRRNRSAKNRRAHRRISPWSPAHWFRRPISVRFRSGRNCHRERVPGPNAGSFSSGNVSSITPVIFVMTDVSVSI